MKNKQLWIARDKSGALFIYESKPERNTTLGCWMSKHKLEHTYQVETKANCDITWENEPIKIKIKKL